MAVDVFEVPGLGKFAVRSDERRFKARVGVLLGAAIVPAAQQDPLKVQAAAADVMHTLSAAGTPAADL